MLVDAVGFGIEGSGDEKPLLFAAWVPTGLGSTKVTFPSRGAGFFQENSECSFGDAGAPDICKGKVVGDGDGALLDHTGAVRCLFDHSFDLDTLTASFPVPSSASETCDGA